MVTNSASYLTVLHQLINQYFNLAEIQMLCLDLHVDYESVAGEEKPSRIRELLLGLGRNGRLPELITLAQRQRPLVEWPPVPDDFELPESLASGGTDTPLNQYHVNVGGSVIGAAIGDGANVSADIIAGGNVTVGYTIDDVTLLIKTIRREDQPIVWNGRIPYLGLTSFQESDAEFFFGRESLVDDLLERVQQANFIVIAGPSGSGKSSVARAGLFHALRGGRLEKSALWLLATMQPKGDPIEQLALALERATKSTQVGDAIRANGDSNPTLLQRQIEMHLTDDPRQRCVLLVDQFEETFTQTKNEETRAAFINLLTTAAQAEAGRIVILLSLRSDFISHCARYPELRHLMSQQFQLVGAMAPPDLAKAITLPALEVGAEIDPALVSRIMADMKGEPGALPLMSFALRDLFEAEKSAKGQPMDLALPAYLKRGGIESALERHANKVFDKFSDEQKALARGVFSKLIEVGQGRADTRRTAVFSELVSAGTGQEAVEAVVITLAKEDVRLITTDGATSDEAITHETITHATVTIAHEKLIDAWPWLRQLVDENREMIALQNQIYDDTQAWVQTKDMGFLYRGGRLLQVEERLQTLNPSLDTESFAFIQASLEQRQKEIEEKEKQRRRIITILATASIIAVTLAGIAFFFFLRATDNAEMASENLMTATAALLVAETANANAVEQRDEALAAGTSEAQALATSKSETTRAFHSEEIAQAQSTRAFENQGTAEAEATRAYLSEGTSQAEAVTAEASEAEAKRQSNMAQAQSVAALSLLVLDETMNDTELATLLAIEAVRMNDYEASNAPWIVNGTLRQTLAHPYFNNTFQEAPGGDTSIALSPDGQTLAIGSSDNSIWLWDLTNPEIDPVILQGHQGPVKTVAFSSDGQMLASGSYDSTIRLWNLADFDSNPIVLTESQGIVYSVVFSPDGKLLASINGGEIHIRNLYGFEVGPIVFSEDVGERDVAFSSNGEVLATIGKNGVVHLRNTRNLDAEPVSLQGEENPTSIAISPNGKVIASGNENGTVRLWNWAEKEINSTILTGHEYRVWSVKFLPDGKRLVSGGHDGTVRIWDLVNIEAEPKVLYGHETLVRSITVSSDGELMATVSDMGSIRLWDLGVPEAEPIVLHGDGFIQAIAITPNGKTLATGSSGGAIRIWKLDDPQIEPVILRGHNNVISSIAFSPDGKTLISGDYDGTILLWDWGNSEAIPIVLEENENVAVSALVAFSLDEEILATSYGTPYDKYQVVQLWQLGDLQSKPTLLHEYEFQGGPIGISSNGQKLATVNLDNAIQVWDLTHPQAKPVVLHNHDSGVSSLALSPDGNTLAFATFDHIIRLSYLENPQDEPVVLRGHETHVGSLAFSPDGKTLASSSGDIFGSDLSIRLWDVDNPHVEPLVLDGHKSVVNSVIFSPDGKTLASGSTDGTVRLWVLLDELIKIGCQKVRRNLSLTEWQRYIGNQVPYHQTCENLPSHSSVPQN